MVIKRNTTVLAIKRQYLKGLKKGSIDIIIPIDTTEEELLFLVEKHKNQVYTIIIFEIIAEHKNSTPKVHELILNNCKWEKELGLINSIITSGNASINTLKKFAFIESRSVQEHLSLAYFKDEIKKINSLDKYIGILDVLEDNDIHNLAKKYIIVSCKNTPKEILERLSKDNQKQVAEEAKRRLGKG